MNFIQDPPELHNTFSADTVLQSILARHLPEKYQKEVTQTLHTMGEMAAGELFELSLAHRTDEPVHTAFDAWGNRIDDISLSPAWLRYRDVATEFGLIGGGYEDTYGEFARMVQFSLVYLFAPSSQLYTCPLAMTDGSTRTLENLADKEKFGEWLANLKTRQIGKSWLSGQWMTEKTGGSDVGLTETVARQDDDGTWRLYGNKFYTSAIISDIALALARPDESIKGGKGLALFAIKLRDDKGNLQNIKVNRLKDKLGTRLVPTAELELEGTPAEPVCELSNGIRNMRFMLDQTRTWNAVCSIAPMARVLQMARSYAEKRVAFGAKLSEKPLHLDTLASMAAEQHASMLMVFENIRMMGALEAGTLSDEERRILSVMTPISKLQTGKQAVDVVSEGIECFGGQGYMEDTGLAELMRDAQVLPIWEGTTNVLSLETYRAMRREDALGLIYEKILSLTGKATDEALQMPAKAAKEAIEHVLAFAKEHASASPQLFEATARRVVMTLGRAMSLALMVEHAQWALDEVKAAVPGDVAKGTFAQPDPQLWVQAARRFASHGVDLIWTEDGADRLLGMGT